MIQEDLFNYMGVPSAHDPNKEFHPKFDGTNWVCDCEHYKTYKTDCRHILVKQLQLKGQDVSGVRDTSIEAYLEIMADPQKLEDIYQDIMKALLKMDKPSTDREIARFLLFSDPNKVRPRRFELADSDRFFPTLIHEVGKRECDVTKKKAYVWELTEHGRKIALQLED